MLRGHILRNRISPWTPQPSTRILHNISHTYPVYLKLHRYNTRLSFPNINNSTCMLRFNLFETSKITVLCLMTLHLTTGFKNLTKKHRPDYLVHALSNWWGFPWPCSTQNNMHYHQKQIWVRSMGVRFVWLRYNPLATRRIFHHEFLTSNILTLNTYTHNVILVVPTSAFTG